MKTIYKFELTDPITAIALPANAEVLDVQVQNNRPQLWVLLETDQLRVERRFITFGTGHPVHEDVSLIHVATWQMNGGELVYHTFEILHS